MIGAIGAPLGCGFRSPGVRSRPPERRFCHRHTAAAFWGSSAGAITGEGTAARLDCVGGGCLMSSVIFASRGGASRGCSKDGRQWVRMVGEVSPGQVREVSARTRAIVAETAMRRAREITHRSSSADGGLSIRRAPAFRRTAKAPRRTRARNLSRLRNRDDPQPALGAGRPMCSARRSVKGTMFWSTLAASSAAM